MTPGAVSRLAEAIGPGCVLVCRPVSLGGQLTREEAEVIAKAIPARRTEFAAGRAAAREALSALGRHGVSIPMGADRAPQWPSGIVGSISHGAGLAVAIVSSSARMQAVGIDIEPDLPLPDDVITTVLRPDERVAKGEERAVFCVKEAIYKALYPLSGEIWDFADVRVQPDPACNRFSAVLSRAAGPVPAGAVLDGHLVIEDGLCLAALALPKGE